MYLKRDYKFPSQSFFLLLHAQKFTNASNTMHISKKNEASVTVEDLLRLCVWTVTASTDYNGFGVDTALDTIKAAKTWWVRLLQSIPQPTFLVFFLFIKSRQLVDETLIKIKIQFIQNEKKGFLQNKTQ